MPTLKADDVLVRVFAAALNPVDCKGRAAKAPVGVLMGFASKESPVIIGFDVAGVVVAVGPVVTRWNIGDEVFAMSNNMGSCAVRVYMCALDGALCVVLLCVCEDRE